MRGAVPQGGRHEASGLANGGRPAEPAIAENFEWRCCEEQHQEMGTQVQGAAWQGRKNVAPTLQH